jgi:acetyl esterase
MPVGIDRRDPAISPQYAEDLSNLPPAIVVTAGVDPFHADAIAYCQRLTDAGVPVTHWDYPGQIHGFVGMDRIFPAGRDAIRRAALAIAAVAPVEDAPATAAFGGPIQWLRGDAQVRLRLREMAQRLPQVYGAHMLGTLVEYRMRALAEAVENRAPITALTGRRNPRSIS